MFWKNNPASKKCKNKELSLHMIPDEVGAGPMVDFDSYCTRSKEIRWISTEANSDGEPVFVRNPQEKTVKFRDSGSFMAAGKKYESLKQLYAVDSGDHMLYKDIYGRHVFYDAERFPCFDSSDYLYEKRFYRWFYILEDGRLTRVYHTDTCDWIYVTEDVCNIENKQWLAMREYQFFDWKG